MNIPRNSVWCFISGCLSTCVRIRYTPYRVGGTAQSVGCSDKETSPLRFREPVLGTSHRSITELNDGRLKVFRRVI